MCKQLILNTYIKIYKYIYSMCEQIILNTYMKINIYVYIEYIYVIIYIPNKAEMRQFTICK